MGTTTANALVVTNVSTSTFAGFIDVNGVGANSTSTFASNLWVKGTLRTGTGSIYLNDTAITAGNGGFSLNTSATSTFTTNGFTVGTSQVVVQQTSGNVGIGIVAPTSQLHLLGTTESGTGVLFDEDTVTSGTALSVTADGLTSGNGLTVSSTGGGTTGKLFSVTSASTGAYANGAVHFNFTGAHTGNGVRITDSTVGGEALQIEVASLTSGKALEINANALTTGTGLGLNSSSNGLAAGGELFGLSYTGNSLLGAIFRVDDEASDSTPFVIDPSGNVGIGTTSPFRLFSVAGSGVFAGDLLLA
ncbi:MAG: hypothetical protein AAB538_05315, partial [Patescibacteria group bacterium]